MYTNYKTITTKQLNELIKIMSPALNDNGHSILLKFFECLIFSFFVIN